MPRTDRIETEDGKAWFVGAYIPWGGDADPASVIIPIDQIAGLSDQQIGRAVRRSVHAAQLCFAEHEADQYISIGDSREQFNAAFMSLFVQFADESPIVARALAIMRGVAQRAKPARPAPPNRAGYIYLVEGENSYKIGKSKQLPARLKAFGLQLPFTTTLIHSIPTSDMVWAETSLHRTFAHCRKNGEWFDLTPDEVAWVCAIPSLEPEGVRV